VITADGFTCSARQETSVASLTLIMPAFSRWTGKGRAKKLPFWHGTLASITLFHKSTKNCTPTWWFNWMADPERFLICGFKISSKSNWYSFGHGQVLICWVLKCYIENLAQVKACLSPVTVTGNLAAAELWQAPRTSWTESAVPSSLSRWQSTTCQTK